MNMNLMNTLINSINVGLIFLLSKPLRIQKKHTNRKQTTYRIAFIKSFPWRNQKHQSNSQLIIGMFIIRPDYPIITIITRPSCTDLLHVNNVIKNVNMLNMKIWTLLFLQCKWIFSDRLYKEERLFEK